MEENNNIINSPYITLFKYGIPYYGPFNGIKYLTTAWVPQIKMIDNDKEIEEYTRITYGCKSTRRFIKKNHEYTGSYGIVDRIECYESSIDNEGKIEYNVETLFRKKSRNRESLLCEACFQIASRQILEEFNLGNSISDVKDIICYDDESIGFTMIPFKNMNFLSDILLAITEEEIVICICKIAFILLILAQELGINHRDLKGNNILISQLYNNSPYIGSINYNNEKAKIDLIYKKYKLNVTKYPNVHFVDFGFSCSGNGSLTEISATNYFPMTDPCPKIGRDLFLLLTHIYITINTRKEKIVKYVGELLEVPGKDYVEFLRLHGEERLDWVYFLLGSSNFKAPKCEPHNLLVYFSEKYPHIIQYTHNK